MEGWTINFTIANLLPLGFGIDTKLVAPAAIIKKGPDGNSIVDVHGDWTFCGWNWFIPSSVDTVPQKQWEDSYKLLNGRCDQWMPETCIKALEEWAKTAYKVSADAQDPYHRKYQCNEPVIPEECRGLETTMSSLTSVKQSKSSLPRLPLPQDLIKEEYPTLLLEYLNGTTTWQGVFEPNMKLSDNATGEMHHLRQKIMRGLNVVLTNFGHLSKNGQRGGDEVVGASAVDPGFAKLSCFTTQEWTGVSTSICKSDNDKRI